MPSSMNTGPFPDLISSIRSASDQNALLSSDQSMAAINQLKLRSFQQQLQEHETATAEWQKYLREREGTPMPGQGEPTLTDSAAADMPYVTSTLTRISDLEKRAKVYARSDPKQSHADSQEADKLRQGLYKTMREESERRGKEYDYVLNHLAGIGAAQDPAETLGLIMPSLKQLFGANPAVAPLLKEIDGSRGLDGKYLWTPRMQAIVQGLGKVAEGEKDREAQQRADIEGKDKAAKAKDEHNLSVARQEKERADAAASKQRINLAREKFEWQKTHPTEHQKSEAKMTEPEKSAYASDLRERFKGLSTNQSMMAATDYDRVMRDAISNKKMSVDDAQVYASDVVAKRMEPTTKPGLGIFGSDETINKYNPTKTYPGSKRNPLPLPAKQADMKPGYYQTARGVVFWNGKAGVIE